MSATPARRCWRGFGRSEASGQRGAQLTCHGMQRGGRKRRGVPQVRHRGRDVARIRRASDDHTGIGDFERGGDGGIVVAGASRSPDLLILAPLPIRVCPFSVARAFAISTVHPNVDRPGCRRAVVGLALGLAMLAVVGAANAAPLLRPAAQTTLSVEKRQQLEADPHVMRWREARMAVDGVFDPSTWDEPLALNLFPDAELEARVRSAKTLESGSQFLSGRLVGGGRFTLFRSAGGILRGEFHSAAGVFTMRSLGPRRVLVKQQDISKLPPLRPRCRDEGGGPRLDHQGIGDGTPPAASFATAAAPAPTR